MKNWIKVALVSDIPKNGGACVKVADLQIAIFNFSKENAWFATQNLCPHKKEMVLSRGLIGSDQNRPKVACPFHKKTFSLEDGSCLSGEDYTLKTYPIKIENEMVFVEV